jgi:hypothetical protein
VTGGITLRCRRSANNGSALIPLVGEGELRGTDDMEN